MAITKECWEQYWTSPGGNTPQGTNYTATCLLSRKLYKLDEPDTQDTAGEAETSSSVMYFYGPPHMAKQKQDDQLKHTYSSYVRIRDIVLKTCQKRWMIGRSGERGSGISVLAARHDDDDDDDLSTLRLLYSFIRLSLWRLVKVSDCGIAISVFELLTNYNANFQTNPQGKGMNALVLQPIG